MALEGNAFFFNFAPICQRKDLKSAAVRQHRSGIIHEFLDAAGFIDNVFTRPQPQVISVGQNDPGPQSLNFLRRQEFHRRQGADRHKHRRFYVAMRRMQDAAAGT